MGLSDWIDTVVDVDVKGCPEVIDDLIGKWQTQFNRVRHVADSLRTGKGDAAQAWNSPAGKAYGEHLETIAKMVDKAEQDLKPIVDFLRDARDALIQAQKDMPVPEELHDDVKNAHDWWLTAIGPVGMAFSEQFQAALSDMWDTYVNDYDDTAADVANRLSGAYDWTDGGTNAPTGQQAVDSNHSAFDPHDPSGNGAGSGVGGLGGAGSAPKLDTKPDPWNGVHPPPGGDGGGPGPDTGRVNPWAGTDDPNWGDRPGTGLSGAGDGLVGAGGMGGGLGGGTEGFGSGLKPASVAGNLVSPFAGGSAAAGAGGRGTSMMGGGHGGHSGGEAAEHESWLTEDDDVWGANRDDLPPPVLGRDDW